MMQDVEVRDRGTGIRDQGSGIRGSNFKNKN